MLDTPQIIETTPQLCARLHLVTPRDEIQHAMGPGIQEVMAALGAQGLAAMGPWFTHHFRRPTETFDFEICVPIAAPMQPSGRVQSGERPAMKVAQTIYHGPYEGLGGAWGEFLDWVETNGHQTTEDLWERYLAGPESGADSAKWKTELSRPLAGA